MKYLAIDLETTGLNPEECQVLQIAAVLEDTENIKPVERLDYFCCFVDHSVIKGDAYALQMNNWILKILAGEDYSKYPINEAPMAFKCFCKWVLELLFRHNLDKITVAGKNVAGFDLKFLSKDITELFDHRTLDPGSLCVDWSRDTIPGLPTLKRQLNIPGDVTHDALEDARDVIRVFRAATNNYSNHIYSGLNDETEN